jgi:hypothetical protein
MYNIYVTSGFCKKSKERIPAKIQDVTVPHRNTIPRIMNKTSRGITRTHKRKAKRKVLTEEKFDEIGAGLNILLDNPSNALNKRLGSQNHQHKLPQNM